MGRRKGNPIDGVLLLDKPLGFSSNQVLQKCKWLYSANKAGHTGSLDPMATGMLPICFGQATKFSHFLLSSDKSYQVQVLLGITTTTGDSEGEMISCEKVPLLERSQIEEVLKQFQGVQQQIPPMFSALKHQGKPLYELARQGKSVERQARTIHINSLRLDEVVFGENPILTLTVVCSKGTYIRTLAEDIGKQLQCGAHVTFLRRLWVVPFVEQSMVELTTLIDMLPDARSNHLLSLDEAFSSILPQVHLTEEETFYLFRGIKLEKEDTVPQGWVVFKGPEGNFLGVGEKLPTGKLAPRRLLTLVSDPLVC